jgi:energy-coupling factor transporter ATP-binding protein EcfA2
MAKIKGASVAPAAGKILKANALGDDRNLNEDGENRRYWYSIGDGFRLLIATRQSKLNYNKEDGNAYTVKAVGEEYSATRENRSGVFVTDPYYIDNFADALTDDIKTVTGTHTVDRHGVDQTAKNNRWSTLPKLVVIPLLSGMHWRAIRVQIDYEARTASILYSDPYGGDGFSDELITRLEPSLVAAINLLISAKIGIEFAIPKESITSNKKQTDQQGREENGFDCGPITFTNIVDYTNIEVSNTQFFDGTVPHSVSAAVDAGHEESLVHLRATDITTYRAIAGIELPGSSRERLDNIKKLLKENAERKRTQLKGTLDQAIIVKISGLSDDACSFIFEIIESARVYSGSDLDKPYTKEELEKAYRLVTGGALEIKPKASVGARGNVRFGLRRPGVEAWAGRVRPVRAFTARGMDVSISDLAVADEELGEDFWNHTNVLLLSKDRHLKSVKFAERKVAGGAIDANEMPVIYMGSKPWCDVPQFAVITGQNGSGKSLLLKYIRHNLTDTRGAIFDRRREHPVLQQRKYLLDKEVLYIPPDHDLSRSSSEKGAQDLSYWLGNERQLEECVTQVLAYIREGTEATQEFAIKVAGNVVKDIALKNLDPAVIDDKYVLSVARKTINYELNELRLTEPLTFISYIVHSYNERKRVIKAQIKDVSGSLTLYDHYDSLDDSDAEAMHDMVDVAFEGKLELRPFLELVSTNSAFKGAVIDDYTDSAVDTSPLDNINAILKRQGFRYQIYLDKAARAHEDTQLVIRDGRKQLLPKDLSSGERVMLTMLTWQFAVQGLSSTGEYEDRQIDNPIRIMLLDEPDAHLDPKLCRLYYKIVLEEFVGRQGIQVIMVTHRMDTVALAPDENVYTIQRMLSGSSEVMKVHKLRAMLRMSGNVRDLVDYHHRVYAESVGDARFYEGAYQSLRRLSGIVRDMAVLEDRRDYYWYIPVEGRAALPLRLLSDRYQLSFYSVSKKNDKGHKKGDGGCTGVKTSIVRDMTAYENLFEGKSTNRGEASSYWVKSRRILNDVRFYSSFGILDNDYGIDHGLAKAGIKGHCVVLKKRHSVESFIFDPIVFCSVLTDEEIHLAISNSNIMKDSWKSGALILNCLKIKHYLATGQYDALQPCLDIFFRIVMSTICDKHKWRPVSKQKAEEKPVYARMADRVAGRADLTDAAMTYIVDVETTFNVMYPTDLFQVRGHDIEEFFFGTYNDYNPADVIVNRVFYDGLPITPLDLAETLFELNGVVRANAREVLRPGEDDCPPRRSEEAARDIQRVWKGYRTRNNWVEIVREQRERGAMVKEDRDIT